MHFDLLNTSVQVEFQNSIIDTTYIHFNGTKAKKCIIISITLHISILCHGKTHAKELHKPWCILQLQKTAYLQEIKAQKQGECEQ